MRGKVRYFSYPPTLTMYHEYLISSLARLGQGSKETYSATE